MTYQLPPGPVHFVDREEEQDRAFRAVLEWDEERSRPLCLALSGLGGTGKTELAFRLARSLQGRESRSTAFEGILYADLDDVRCGGVVESADVLAALLRSLKVEPEWIEQSFDARRKQYWEQTHGKRLLVILDNAHYGAEVEPLLPSSGASVVIIASHGPLYELQGGAAEEFPLGPLDKEHAAELLRLVADDPRLDAEPEAVRGLLSLCDGLPAAVHVAGRWIRRHRRRPLSRMLDELTAELRDNGMPMVEKVWDAAYRSLGPEAARLYRLLAAAPGPSLPPEGAAALLGDGREAVDAAWEELETAGLLDSRERERLRLHGLLRAHARRRADRDGTPEESSAGQGRLIRWYLRQAQRADVKAAGPRLAIAEPAAEAPYAADVPFDGKPQALSWLEEERHVLYGCVRAAHARGLHHEAWAMCEPLWTHFMDHRHYADVIDAFGTGLAAALQCEDLPAIVRMRCQLARPLWEQGEFQKAAAELELAFNGAQALGTSRTHRILAASVMEFRGTLRMEQGEWHDAAADFEASRRQHLEIPNDYGVMLQTYRLGQAVAALGELERAADLLEQAHAGFRELGRERLTARAGFALGGVLQRLGRGDTARGLYAASLASARDRGADRDAVLTLDALAQLADETRDEVGAREHRAEAAALRDRHGGLSQNV
ncbi:NB-ARC domain-containing protein [Streptomyces sp. WMMB 714]|uniref:NB-ARC domain-containing protein n=1 Tax=Streptomyces sp. WMMB 714 TaxID=1286822 RepID=UPI0005F7EC0C|nr:NB-ARC domain-containing protein [Streptomyces sp. WMMB 714]SCK11487.1 NB-ARC domain-containing protein [Streptomyces sp. WMMB 714]